ncbi:DUF1834 family protein [Methylobacterium ajmalii]|uniref:DUF1834 family protein n=1 Tax=Methylobacterium ajmalii TaxID=2738439 RepID=A0ABV0A4Y4_9HYPH
MSQITEFRDKVMATLRTKVPTLREVEWYDGLFDETDMEDWIVNAPAAYVAAIGVPYNDPHSTGEMNLCLRMVVTVIVEDRIVARDADPQCWELLERIADVVNMNSFGDPNAAPANIPTLKRLRDPELRRQGVALGVVEWMQGFTLGTSRSEAHEYPHHPDTGKRFDKIPDNLFIGESTVRRGNLVRDDRVDLSPPDPASPYLGEDAL